MPNVRAANKVKIGAWVDRTDAANLRLLAQSQGLHLSELIEKEMQRVLPRLITQAGTGCDAQRDMVKSDEEWAAVRTALR